MKDFYDMDEAFLEKRFTMMQQFLKDKIEYWQQVPRVFFIVQGKNGWSDNDAAARNKLYRLGRDSRYYVDCQTAEIVSSFGNRTIVTLHNNLDDNFHVRELVLSTFGQWIYKIDGERVYTDLIRKAESSRFSTVGSDTIDRWITDAIMFGIDIDFSDYCLHFDAEDRRSSGNNFDMTEKQFQEMYERYCVDIANKVLINV